MLGSTTRILAEIAQTLDSVTDPTSRLARALSLSNALLHSERCSVSFDSGKGPARDVMTTPPAASDAEHRAVAERLAVFAELVEADGRLPDGANGYVLGLPLLGTDKIMGFLLAERTGSAYSDREVRLFAIVASQLGGYLALLRLHEKVIELDRFRQGMYALVVHDLKNPLAAILANLDFVAQEVSDLPETVKSCLADVGTASERMLRLVANLLDLARLESSTLPLQRSPVDLGSLLSGLARQRAMQARSNGVEVVLADLPASLEVEIDEGLISRSIDNVLDNALRYTPRGGRIGIDTDVTDSRLRVVIGNTGPEIPEHVRDRIFEKHGQAGPAGRMNLGLGLYFCRLALEAHGGRISAARTPDFPAAFVFELPVSAVRGEADSTVRRSSAETSRDAERLGHASGTP